MIPKEKNIWDAGGRLKREGTYVHLRLIHIVVWQKPTQHCKAIILQLKKNHCTHIIIWAILDSRLPRWHSGKEFACQCRRYERCRFNPREKKIPWKRKQQPTPVFSSRKSHGQRSLAGSSLQGHKESNATERLSKHSGFHKEGTLPLSENKRSTAF